MVVTSLTVQIGLSIALSSRESYTTPHTEPFIEELEFLKTSPSAAPSSSEENTRPSSRESSRPGSRESSTHVSPRPLLRISQSLTLHPTLLSKPHQ